MFRPLKAIFRLNIKEYIYIYIYIYIYYNAVKWTRSRLNEVIKYFYVGTAHIGQ